MSNGDFANPINDIDNEHADTVYIQNVCLDHLKFHKIKSHPEKAEFLMLFGGLLESKIKYKIKKEISSGIPDYWDEFSTLITRCKPFGKFDHWYYDNPFEYENIKQDLQNSTPNLAQFIVERFTYNNPDTIFRIISDFALVEDYKEFNQITKPFDLQNSRIEKYIEQRNDAVHDVVNAKICDTDYVQNYLDKIYEDILDMISRALKIREITNKNLKSSEKDHIIKCQSDWLKKILNDLDSYSENKPLPRETKYYHLFNKQKSAREELKNCVKVKMIQKKIKDI